jgi:hypothetical protein
LNRKQRKPASEEVVVGILDDETGRTDPWMVTSFVNTRSEWRVMKERDGAMVMESPAAPGGAFAHVSGPLSPPEVTFQLAVRVAGPAAIPLARVRRRECRK